jgi:hypothetical protein
MRWQPALVAVASVIPLTSAACYQPPPPAAGCPAGHASYQAGEVALRLGENDAGSTSSLRLPFGKVVVVVWPEICASGEALQVLGPLQPPNVQGRTYASAFRAVRIGKATLHRVDSCGEVCMKPFSVGITVTDGCEVLSRNEVSARWLRGGGDWTWSAKLTRAKEYEQLFATPTAFAADEPVWAILGTSSSASMASAVDACTDYVSGAWNGTGVPAGWSSLTDQSLS